MTDGVKNRTRGPLVSSRKVLTKDDLASAYSLPEAKFASAAYDVVFDLMRRVGAQDKITVTIEPLKKEHPQSPGYMIAAKMRRV